MATRRLDAVSKAAAVVLTGGQSSRMGTDKASLLIDGVAMADRVCQILRDVGVQQIVVAGSAEFPDPEIAEGRSPQGPMAGVVSGWNALQQEGRPDPIVVLSCDLPALTPHVVRGLIAASLQHAHGAVAHDGERQQPLIAAYRPAALDHLRQAFYAGERSVRRCFADWDLASVPFERTLLADADQPSDLEGFDVQWPSDGS